MSAATEKRIRSELHGRYIARLESLLPAGLTGADRRFALDGATRAAAPDADIQAATARLTATGLSAADAGRLISAARDLLPDIDRTVEVETRAAARAEKAFLPRVLGGVVLGIAAIGAMAGWEAMGLAPGGVYYLLLPQLLAAGLILFGLFDRQTKRDGRQFARRLRDEYRARRADDGEATSAQ